MVKPPAATSGPELARSRPCMHDLTRRPASCTSLMDCMQLAAASACMQWQPRPAARRQGGHGFDACTQIAVLVLDQDLLLVQYFGTRRGVFSNLFLYYIYFFPNKIILLLLYRNICRCRFFVKFLTIRLIQKIMPVVYIFYLLYALLL
jgi:hypothetical protein